MKTKDRSSRTIWQPLNRKSQVVATIAILAAVSFSAYTWHTRSIQSSSAQPQTVQQLPAK